MIPSVTRSIGTVTLPTVTTGQQFSIPVHVGTETQAYLESLIAKIPADKQGQARLVIDLKGVDLDVAAKVGHKGPFDIEVAGGAGVDWQGKNPFAGAEIRLQWD